MFEKARIFKSSKKNNKKKFITFTYTPLPPTVPSVGIGIIAASAHMEVLP
jgi:hypothetical protein